VGPLDDEIQERDEFDLSMIGRPIHAIWEPIDPDGQFSRLELMGVLEYVIVNGDALAIGVKTVVEKQNNGWSNLITSYYTLTVRVSV
jgi:hypothetical protein